MAYSRDYKERAVAYKEEGHTFKQLKEAFGIWSETYYEWKEKLGSGYYDIHIEPDVSGAHNARITMHDGIRR